MVKVRDRKLKIPQTPCMIEVTTKKFQITDSQAFLESHNENELNIKSPRILKHCPPNQELKNCPITLICMLGSARHCVVSGIIREVNVEQSIIIMQKG